MKKKKLPADANQRAKAIVDFTTSEQSNSDDGKNPAAVALGRKGGLIGGKARAASLSAEKRSDIARKAATARWKDNGK